MLNDTEVYSIGGRTLSFATQKTPDTREQRLNNRLVSTLLNSDPSFLRAIVSNPRIVYPAKMENIKNLSLSDLILRLKNLGVERYRFEQVLKWIYSEDLSDFSEMTNLSKDLRHTLATLFELPRLSVLQEQVSSDGTRKYLIGLSDSESVEAVLIPNDDRLTLCISSQVGCAMGCRYCLTAKVGLKRHLSQFEILEQVLTVRRRLQSDQKITNLVFMGMGEPLHNLKAVLPALEILIHPFGLNLSKRKVTVSTSGLVPEMTILGQHSAVRLAISLCATTNETRNFLVPINRKYPLEVLLDACRKYPLPARGRITMEYVMVAGINDHLEDARRLPKILKGIPSKVNLIPWNEFPGVDFRRPSDESILNFQNVLLQNGLQTNIRASRGRDILGACGQLKANMELRTV